MVSSNCPSCPCHEPAKADVLRPNVCRTINLAKHAQQHAVRPNMDLYDKCRPPCMPCIPVAEIPMHPTCIRVCDKEEFLAKTCPTIESIRHPAIGHGKLMYLVKAGILAGVLAFTINQGIWGSQLDTTECYRRWQEYFRSLNSRRPPNFDKCGRVIMKETSDSIIAPIYTVYKEIVTTIFSGIVKFPSIMKCWYLEYQQNLEQKYLEEVKESKLRKTESRS